MQMMNVAQTYPKFRADYPGENSFPPGGKASVGSTTNALLGVRLWEGDAACFNLEIDWGYGLNSSVGAANDVDAAVVQVGAGAPCMRFQRYFLRQIIVLGGERRLDPDQVSRNEALESTQNQISGKVDQDRLIVTLGKFAVGDVFDDNIYAHDLTTGFLNFAFNTMGAFNYAADSWGYNYWLATEWKQSWWTLRAGVLQLSEEPNGEVIERVLFEKLLFIENTHYISIHPEPRATNIPAIGVIDKKPTPNPPPGGGAMKTFNAVAAFCILASGASAAPFEKTLNLQGLTFHVTSANDSSAGMLKIVVDGLKGRTSSIERQIDGTAIGAEIADLDANGFPEIYVYTQSAGSGSYGEAIGYASNKNKSVTEIFLTPMTKSDAQGYLGHDEFSLVERYLVRRFPIYRAGDANAKPTGGLRQIQYRLRPGEAGWSLRRVKAINFPPGG